MNPRLARTRVTLVAALATLLATSALWPLLETERWPYGAVLAVAVVAATGWLTRSLRVPALLAPLATAATLLVLLTVMYAPTTTVFFAVPTPASLEALRDLVTSGFIDVRRFATPAPESAGLLLLTVGGVGIVAILVDLVAVRLGHPGVAGLPMLALYSVSAGVLVEGPGWIPFLAGALGFLALLLADNREHLERWGRPVVTRRSWERRQAPPVPPTANTAPMAGLGRRIGGFAVVTAVLAPTLVPLTDQSFVGGDGAGSSWLRRFGAPALRAPDPVVSMRRDLLRQSNQVIFSYTSTADRPEYLRTVALTEFNGETWKPGRLRGYDEFTVEPNVALPQSVGSDPTITRTTRTRVTLRDEVSVNFLPAPYAPAEVDAGNGWYYEPDTLTVFSPRGSVKALRYTVTSEVPLPSPTQLDIATDPGVTVKDSLRLPSGLPQEVRAQARQITRGKKTDYRKALALQEWFTETGGFTYSTEPGGNGTDALRDFLRTRRGYCEQYASAMAVMARMLGIPARAAVGFTQGTRVRDDEWEVRGKDAHAWPELWFEGVGWIRFEPTPTGATGQGTADIPGYSERGALSRGTDGGADDRPDIAATGGGNETSTAPGRQRLEATDDPATGAERDSGVGTPLRLGLAGAALLLVAVVGAPALTRRLIRRHRWRRARDPGAVAHAAWTELRDDATDLRFVFRASDSPRTAGARLSARLEPDAAAAAAVERVALAEERARYAPSPDTPAGLRADVRAARAALRRRVSWRSRLRAQLLPASVFCGLRETLRGLAGRYEDLRTAADARLFRRQHRT